MNRPTYQSLMGIIAAFGVLAVLSAEAPAADQSSITVTPDKDVAARTNMTRSASDTSKLNVTFDRDVAQRTNMHRDAGDVGSVTVTQDKAVMERTNMGGTALKPAKAEAIQTGSK